jgi:UPF0042 nucleotide-binding protein
MTPRPPKTILLVTGMSGAGKSTTMRTLEDSGWEVVDNVPLGLLDRLRAAPAPQGYEEDADRPLAIGIDSRTRGFDAAGIVKRLEALRRSGPDTVETLFLDCAGAVLERRYSETRRRHPLALDRPAADGIARERELMAPLRRHADHLIDTTDHAANALQAEIRARFGRATGSTLTLMSFGYSRGLPRNADLVFDLRFLRNPHWDAALRPQTGLDPAVGAFIREDSAYADVFERIDALLKRLLPRYSAEGKAYVTVAFGCTGGRHRSVFFTEAIARSLREAGFSPTVSHRNLESAPLDAYENRRQDDAGVG